MLASSTASARDEATCSGDASAPATVFSAPVETGASARTESTVEEAGADGVEAVSEAWVAGVTDGAVAAGPVAAAPVVTVAVVVVVVRGA